jgi:arylsulfatase A-like enzyme
MNHFNFLLISLSLIFISLLPSYSQNKSLKNPNVIIIFADDMGYGDVSYLNPKARTFTPHIDNLARNGIVFTNAHASASVCTPSRYGLLTGRYAWRSKSAAVVANGFSKSIIEDDRETIANLFKNAGYSTACIGKWHLGLDWQTKKNSGEATFFSDSGFSNLDYTKKVKKGPDSYGFDYSFILPASLDMPPYVFLRNNLVIDPLITLTSDIYPSKLDDTEYSWDRKHTNEHDVYLEKMVWWRRGEISKSFRIENSLTEILDDGISYVEKHAENNSSKPFFMYMPLTGPHTPWVPTDMFKEKSSIGTYGDFILNIDHVVGQITETLKRLGIYDNTIIIFSSDNGAYWPKSEIELNQHDSHLDRRGQKGDIWDGGHRIPLIISWPNQIKKEGYFDHLVSLTDLFATIADLTNQEQENKNGEDSFSFFHVFNGDLAKGNRYSMVHQSSGGMFSLRMEEWKYIEGLGSGGFTDPRKIEPKSDGVSGQLYQLKNDPSESINLFLKHPNVVNKLLKELNKQKTESLIKINGPIKNLLEVRQ